MNKIKNHLVSLLLLVPLAACAEKENNLSGLWESYKRFGHGSARPGVDRREFTKR